MYHGMVYALKTMQKLCSDLYLNFGFREIDVKYLLDHFGCPAP